MHGQPSENFFFAKRSSFWPTLPAFLFVLNIIRFSLSQAPQGSQLAEHISLCVERRKLIYYASGGKERGRGSEALSWLLLFLPIK